MIPIKTWKEFISLPIGTEILEQSRMSKTRFCFFIHDRIGDNQVKVRDKINSNIFEINRSFYEKVSENGYSDLFYMKEDLFDGDDELFIIF